MTAYYDNQTWEALRELAVLRMRDEGQDAGARYRWVRLALTACRLRSEGGDACALGTLADVVAVRVYAIEEFGVRRGDLIRDPVFLCETVFREFGASPAGVAAEAVDWRALPRLEMLRLRRIKNVLTLLRPMRDVLPVDDPIHRELSEWLALLPGLP
ncbi:hypothetical protein [Streptomyces sp. NPDC026659]|uniref:hypothetical protein n=1 Tax=Streptomyces sp. NPDC026659 TaxID=3155123 RepID=UPI0033E004A6